MHLQNPSIDLEQQINHEFDGDTGMLKAHISGLRIGTMGL